MRLPLAHLERAGVLLLLLAALTVHARHLERPFEHGFGGYQGAFFAIAAVGYERFGVASSGGYPALALDGPCWGGLDDLAPLEPLSPERAPGDQELARPGDEARLVYRNHPPTAMLLAWASMRAFAPEGWKDAWRTHEAPREVERAERLPFLALHVLGLFAFWWAMRVAIGPGAALIGLALFATAPIALFYGSLANLETPSLPGVLFALGFHARWLRTRAVRDLVRAALAVACAASFTWTPLFFVPVLALQAGLRIGFGAAVRSGLSLGAAAALPLFVHTRLAGRIAAPEQDYVGRAHHLFAPLLDGSRPLDRWLRLQAEHAFEALGPVLALAALAGLVIAGTRLARAMRSASGARSVDGRDPDPRRRRAASTTSHGSRVDLVLPLSAGALLFHLAFYRHTFEDQPNFALYLAPAAAAAAALAIEACAPFFLRLRAGVAPLVVATSLVALPGLAWTDVLARRQARVGEPAPQELARTVRELVPAGSTCLAPAALGFDFQTAYYAWRNLVPLAVPSAFEELRARLPVLGARPAAILLPDAASPSPAPREWIEQAREHAVPGRSAGGFELWIPR